MSKRWIETLYDAAKTEDDNGLSKFDEQKLRKHLEGNTKLGARNKDVFSAGEKRFHTCLLYNPCPICDKCLNKASHLYIRCQNCEIPICTHKYKDKERLIKRYNFRTIVSNEVYEKIKENDKDGTNGK